MYDKLHRSNVNLLPPAGVQLAHALLPVVCSPLLQVPKLCLQLLPCAGSDPIGCSVHWKYMCGQNTDLPRHHA